MRKKSGDIYWLMQEWLVLDADIKYRYYADISFCNTYGLGFMMLI